MKNPSNRRDFMKASALAGIGFWIAGREARADDAVKSKSPNEKVNIACIGVGGKGDSDSEHAGMYGNLVGICDIDDNFLDRKGQKFPNAKKYNDFRKMLDEMGKSIDAVVISIPDHNHTVAAMMAMKMGKHVYCQKPLTHNVAEARLLRETAAKEGLVTQMGNQGTSADEFRRGVEILRAGLLGPVKEVHVWTNRPIWPQAPDIESRPAEMPVPSTIHWDQWIGTAPLRPYNKAYHPFKWRGFLDFGTGALGDMGCHTCNLPFMGLELGYPADFRGSQGDLNAETYPSWAMVVFNFPARGNKPPVKLTWWEGHRKDGKRNIPNHATTHDFDLPESGSLIIGEKGMMMSLDDYGRNLRLIFNGDTEGFSGKAPQLFPRTGGFDDKHKLEWISAIKGGPKPLSNFAYAGMLTEFILLGNVAIRAGNKKLEWDGPNMKITNEEAANQLLSREYRKGWEIA